MIKTVNVTGRISEQSRPDIVRSSVLGLATYSCRFREIGRFKGVPAIFEIVHTVTEYYDGPRRGIAELHGGPHLFESEWRDNEDMDADTFLLMPIDAEVFSLALEDLAIWRRWETAFRQGNATQDTHPALPQDRQRHEELKPLLEGHLVVDPARSIRMKAEFRIRSDPEWSGYGLRPLEVRWEQAP